MRKRVCKDCGVNEPPMFILKNLIWLQVAKKDEILCLSCFEKRLGRLVHPDDLQSCLMTRELELGYQIFKRGET